MTNAASFGDASLQPALPLPQPRAQRRLLISCCGACSRTAARCTSPMSWRSLMHTRTVTSEAEGLERVSCTCCVYDGPGNVYICNCFHTGEGFRAVRSSSLSMKFVLYTPSCCCHHYHVFVCSPGVAGLSFWLSTRVCPSSSRVSNCASLQARS